MASLLNAESKMRRSRNTKVAQAKGQHANMSIYTGTDYSGTTYQYWAQDNCLDVGSEVPPDPLFKRCRYWVNRALFLKPIFRLKLSFYNYGFAVKPRGGRKKPAKAGTPNVHAEWWSTNRWAIQKVVQAIWREWMGMDNVISFWRTKVLADGSDVFQDVEGNFRPILLRPEDIEYSDNMGEERIKLKKQFSPEEKRKMSEAARARYGNGPLVLGCQRDKDGSWVPDPTLGERYIEA